VLRGRLNGLKQLLTNFFSPSPASSSRLTDAGEDQIRTWLDAFLSLGKPSLMAKLNLQAEDTLIFLFANPTSMSMMIAMFV